MRETTLANNQFLKIKIIHKNWIDFEIWEMPDDLWRRPRRFHLQTPISHLVNRHTRKSKIKFIERQITNVKRGFDTAYE